MRVELKTICTVDVDAFARVLRRCH